jgi:guanine deaminase
MVLWVHIRLRRGCLAGRPARAPTCGTPAPGVANHRAEAYDAGMPEPAFMRRAIELAREGMRAGAGGPFGAVVVKDGTIIGEGHNEVVGTNDPTAHGEIVAIRAACARIGHFSLEGCEIYTTGEPCPMCLGAIHWSRVSHIYYGFDVADAATIGFDDREFYRQFTIPAPKRVIPCKALLVTEAKELLGEYMAMPNRVPY